MERNTLTDRELLRLAAKAAGIEYRYQPGSHRFLIKAPLATMDGTYFTYWDPLTNDGDALRLAVKLNLPISFETWTDGSEVVLVETETEYFDSDPYAATRRAIVRAAAEIGKDMK